jgi:hypothetical protein
VESLARSSDVFFACLEVPPTPTAWSSGLTIIPDYALLTGEKIPPVTPNIIDVRIVRQEVTADFPSINPRSNH